LQSDFNVEWDGISPDLYNRKKELFDELERHYEETTRYFKNKSIHHCRPDQTLVGKFSYMDLVTAHLREAPRSYRDAQHRVDTNTREWMEDMYDRPWRDEAMMKYWDYMGDYVRYMRAMRYEGDDKTLEESWIILMFRAFLWQRTHVGVANDPALPSRFYGSGLAVYIG
jgi:hypothetical protein